MLSIKPEGSGAGGQVALSPGTSWEHSRPGNAGGKQKGTKGKAESWDQGAAYEQEPGGETPWWWKPEAQEWSGRGERGDEQQGAEGLCTWLPVTSKLIGCV